MRFDIFQIDNLDFFIPDIVGRFLTRKNFLFTITETYAYFSVYQYGFYLIFLMGIESLPPT